MIKVGILSVSDGRERVHEGLLPYIKQCEKRLCQALATTGEVELVGDGEVIHDNSSAKIIAKRMAAANPDVVADIG